MCIRKAPYKVDKYIVKTGVWNVLWKGAKYRPLSKWGWDGVGGEEDAEIVDGLEENKN